MIELSLEILKEVLITIKYIPNTSFLGKFPLKVIFLPNKSTSSI